MSRVDGRDQRRVDKEVAGVHKLARGVVRKLVPHLHALRLLAGALVLHVERHARRDAARLQPDDRRPNHKVAHVPRRRHVLHPLAGAVDADVRLEHGGQCAIGQVVHTVRHQVLAAHLCLEELARAPERHLLPIRLERVGVRREGRQLHGRRDRHVLRADDGGDGRRVVHGKRLLGDLLALKLEDLERGEERTFAGGRVGGTGVHPQQADVLLLARPHRNLHVLQLEAGDPVKPVLDAGEAVVLLVHGDARVRGRAGVDEDVRRIILGQRRIDVAGAELALSPCGEHLADQLDHTLGSLGRLGLLELGCGHVDGGRHVLGRVALQHGRHFCVCCERLRAWSGEAPRRESETPSR
eukprot:7391506-Prymnesium_polylepis.1